MVIWWYRVMSYESEMTGYGIIWLWWCGCDMNDVGVIRYDVNVIKYQSDCILYGWVYAIWLWHACDICGMEWYGVLSYGSYTVWCQFDMGAMYMMENIIWHDFNVMWYGSDVAWYRFDRSVMWMIRTGYGVMSWENGVTWCDMLLCDLNVIWYQNFK